ncbi:MAG: TetR/AcrR family transcriptional regulator [Enterocloster sp.]
MKKENQRIALTKRLLKESLIQLMSEKNIQKITVCELCETSGINRSTFYNHYGCPADVLKEMELDLVSDLEAIWKKNPEQYWTTDQRIEAVCSYLKEHSRPAKLLFQNSSTDSEFAEALFQSARVMSVFEQTLSFEENPYDRKLLLTFLTNGIYYMIRQWLLEDMPKTPYEMGQLALRTAAREWDVSPDGGSRCVNRFGQQTENSPKKNGSRK